MKLRALVVAASIFVCAGVIHVSAQRPTPLRGIKLVHVEETVVAKPEKVKEDFAPNLIQDSLRNALRNSNFEIADNVAGAPIRAHMVLDEFTSGNTAKRLLVGFGSGRSTVDARMVFQSADGKELTSVRIRVKGALLFSGYQGGNTQRRQATSSLDQKLIEEIARLK